MSWFTKTNLDFAKKRANRISQELYSKKMDFEYMIKEYFVEIFCWGVPSISTLEIISNWIGDRTVFDPAAGSGFHCYLLEQLGIEYWAADNQPDKDSWVDVKEFDSWRNDWGVDGGVLWVSYFPGMCKNDSKSLIMHAITLRKWDIIITIGNYTDIELNMKGLPYKCVWDTIEVQEWGDREKFVIYKRHF